MRFINDQEIQLDKIINELDQLALDVVEIIRKFSEYVIVGGYVSILLGRSRMSEDIDILIPSISKERFTEIFEDLDTHNFWCINSKSVDDCYRLLIDDYAIRITRSDWVIPNIELRFISDELDNLTFETRMKVRLPKDSLMVSRPEIQIPYKRNVLGSNKDIEDAIHLEEIFKGRLDKNLLKKCQGLIVNEYKEK
jgi:hypothetical protein